ncbi:hypothetical protein HQ49_03175 [Porphyromonas gulae]|nr:hypothetical protein HQ49_03175 [Porphyromonas gulae]KGL54624.1 hypothetical protein HQ50_08985 [Porphyromonas sp. COT-052 OH4946]
MESTCRNDGFMSTKIKLSILILHTLFSLFSCQGKASKNAEDLVAYWFDREIIIPDSLVFTRFATDTVPFDYRQKPYRILVYGDSTGCTGCELQLKGWMRLMKELEEIAPNQIEYLFILFPNDKQKLKTILQNERFYYPVCIDECDKTNTLNRFPKQKEAHTFLLDSSNKVKIIGNPVYNHEIEKLYKNELGTFARKKIDKEERLPITNIHLSTKDIWYGQLTKGDTIESDVFLYNRGEHSFKIEKIIVSCDCTATWISKGLVESGDSARLHIRLVAEEEGDLFRTVAIHGNISSSPLVVSLSGKVISINHKKQEK